MSAPTVHVVLFHPDERSHQTVIIGVYATVEDAEQAVAKVRQAYGDFASTAKWERYPYSTQRFLWDMDGQTGFSLQPVALGRVPRITAD